jgi:adenine-specific DNA-methyltransferase
VLPPKGSSWRRPPDELRRLIAEKRIYWGRNGDADFPVEKKFLSEVKAGVVPQTWWPYEFAGSTRNASAELKGLFEGSKAFDTPKPERFAFRVFEVATNPGDVVLDSFLGSGTTAAVAHKMGRRYIGIEMGEHAVTHCAPRLNKVIEGEQGGISETVNWGSGGGFRFYRLGPPVFDEEGHIRSGIRFPVLAAHIWFSETTTPWTTKRGTPLLGFHDGRAFALLYNGILADKRVDGGNVLTRATLKLIREKIAKKDPTFDGPLTVYGEQSRITAPTLDREGVTFKQTPYDVKARR